MTATASPLLAGILPFASLAFTGGPQDQGVTHTEEKFRFLTAPPL
jgi:hypothetical protein